MTRTRPPPPPSPKAARETRLAQALRANLRRRKAPAPPASPRERDAEPDVVQADDSAAGPACGDPRVL